jgi:hypothetical protein
MPNPIDLIGPTGDDVTVIATADVEDKSVLGQTATPSLGAELARRIHGADVYAGFVPTFPEDLQGWNSQHDIFKEILSQGARIIVDVGVWKGGSTIFLADLLKQRNVAGVVIAVDTFLGSAEHWNRDSDMFDLIPRRHGMPLLYEQFLTNVVRRGLQEYIVPLPQTSETAAAILKRLGIRPDLVHLDAGHEYDCVLRDARVYWEILTPEGYLVGDDYVPLWDGVVQAANVFSTQVGVTLTEAYPKWVLHKPGG